MSVYLVRSLLLSLFIAVLVTACYYMLREEVKTASVIEFKKSLQSWSAGYTLQAFRTPFTGSDKAFKQAVEKNMQATTARLRAAGYRSEIKLNNDSSYSIDISRITDTIYIRNLIASNTRMSFYEVYTLNDLASVITTFPTDFFQLLNPAQPYQDESGKIDYTPYIGICKPGDTAKLMSVLSDSSILSKFPSDIQFMYGEPDTYRDAVTPLLFLYAVRTDPDALSNRYITRALPEHRGDEQLISFQFDAAGTKRWERMTAKNVGKPIAICINDKVFSAPNVIQPIQGGSSLITMGQKTNFETCRILSVLLTSEDLLLPVKITQTHITEETLSLADGLSPLMKYILAFIAAFAISFSIIWFIFKPGRNARTANP